MSVPGAVIAAAKEEEMGYRCFTATVDKCDHVRAQMRTGGNMATDAGCNSFQRQNTHEMVHSSITSMNVPPYLKAMQSRNVR